MSNQVKVLFLSIFLLLVNSLFTAQTYAHQTSTAYFSGQLNDSGSLEGQVQIRLRDLERSVGLDTNRDGQLSWGETLARQEAVETFFLNALTLERNNQDCPIAFTEPWQLDNHFNEVYLVLPLRSQCAVQGNVSLDYQGLFYVDQQHKLLVSISDQKQSFSRVIDSSNRSVTLDAKNGSSFATFKEFVKQGAIHIWIGTDHILFVLCLLLACVYGASSQANRSYKQVLWELFGIVTAFTIAHSVTLTATALNWITVSSKWVEVGIAITVLAAALNNIFPVVKKIAWLTFGFGLLHGMGFAGVLGELGLPSDQKFLSVLAFNIGVEFGQIVIIAIALPILFLTKFTKIKSSYWLNIGSAAIAVMAVIWVWERLL